MAEKMIHLNILRVYGEKSVKFYRNGRRITVDRLDQIETITRMYGRIECSTGREKHGKFYARHVAVVPEQFRHLETR